jgi:predicted AAA+ superfamily ATPase
MEKLFLYLCMNSSGIFNAQAASKELENISVTTLENYIGFLEKSNLIYRSDPVDVGSKGALKGRPKIFIADAAIRNAVLMIDDVLADEKEMGIMVETAVYKHIVSFYQGSTARTGYFRKLKENQKEVDVVIELPKEKILCEVKYRNDSNIPAIDAIVKLADDEKSKVSSAFVITKKITDYGISKHKTKIPILRVPALPFLYLIGKIEAEGNNAKM